VTSAQTYKTDPNYVPVYKFDYHENFIRCKDGSLIEKTIEVEHWPIEHYKWSDGREIYAAIDPVLREILDMEVEKVEKLEWERSKLLKDLQETNKEVENLQHDLDSYMEIVHEYANMSFWQRFKFLFKGN